MTDYTEYERLRAKIDFCLIITIRNLQRTYTKNLTDTKILAIAIIKTITDDPFKGLFEAYKYLFNNRFYKTASTAQYFELNYEALCKLSKLLISQPQLSESASIIIRQARDYITKENKSYSLTDIW